MKNAANFLIILAGICWASMGIFVRLFSDYGFTSLQIVAIRLVFAALTMDLFFLIFGRKYFIAKLHDIPLFVLIGVSSIFMMSVFYFKTITVSSLTVAAILLYTAPILVMLMSVLFFKEKLTFRKLFCLFIAFIGCILVTGTGGSITAWGILFGVLSGFCYALYSILGKIALKKAHPYTISIYAFNAGAFVSLCSCGLKGTIHNFSSQNILQLLLLGLCCGILTAVFPYILYTIGLRTTPAGKAAIMAFAEPLFATLFGILLFKENLTLSSFAGIILILFSILLLNNFGRQLKNIE